MYNHFLKPIFFTFDPEFIHDRITTLGSFLGRYSFSRKVVSLFCDYENSILSQDILGKKFKNPVGLSAGFDKNAQLLGIMPSVGFGHMEIGSITSLPCEGNAKPRLWRLKKSKGLVVHYGLKNDGAEKIHTRLKNIKAGIPVFTSIAMTNCAKNLDIDTAIQDYVDGFSIFVDEGDFFTINISCPNTMGGQPFVDPHNLDLLLTKLDEVTTAKPVFVKFSPDITEEVADALLEVLSRHKVKGIICSNLTKKRNSKELIDDTIPEHGGISGKPVQELSDRLLAHVYRKSKGKFVLIGVGGVFTAEDAYKKIRLGASVIQMITGLIFEGPQVIGRINRDLAKLLERDGFKNITEAIGVDNQK